MSWFTSISLKAKILLFILGLFLFAALIPTTPSSPEPQPTLEIEESPRLGDQDIKEEEKAEEKSEEETITNTQPKPAPKPAPEPSPNCEPSYTNVCIPVGSADYDCAGGSGNGPNYISGPVYVRHDVENPDPHGLDKDKDGVGCEN